METKVCFKCNNEKPLIEFGNNKSKKDGKNQYCKSCANEKSKEWSRRNVKKIQIWNKERHAKAKNNNPEKYLQEKKDYYQKNIDRWAFSHLKKTYGLTVEQFEKMKSVKKCQICGNNAVHTYKGRGCKSGKIVVDHNHTTGKIRGFICTYCNIMIGNAKDNIQTLKNAIRYLEIHGA